MSLENFQIEKSHCDSRLRYLFVAGEHCDHETKNWAEKSFNVTMLNHWWQTETGHSITAHCLGYQHDTVPPKYSTGLPFPGYDGKYVNIVMLNWLDGRAHCVRILPESLRKNVPKGQNATHFTSVEGYYVYYYCGQILEEY
jgi:Acyl-coenzyme A synthetases/AMP-(fatty) acid ligases